MSVVKVKGAGEVETAVSEDGVKTEELHNDCSASNGLQPIHKKSNSMISFDLETAITYAGFGKFNYLLLLIAFPASGTAAFATGAMSYVIPVAGLDLELTPLTKALLQSAPFVGMILSGFIWGVLSDSFGRQRLLAVGFLLDFTMNTLCGLIQNLPAMMAFKFLSGFMVCGPFSIFTAYLSEIFLAKRRDIAVLSTGIFCSVLQILHVCVALILIPAKPPDWLPLQSWQLFILFSGLPSLISGICCALSIESPKFLAEKGKNEKSLKACRKIYTINTGLKPDTYPVKKIQKPVEFLVPKKKMSPVKKLLATTAVFRSPYVYRLLMVVTIQLSIASTLNLLRLWLPEMLTLMSNADPAVANQTNTLCPLLIAGHKAQVSSSHVVSKNEVYYDMIVVNSGTFTSQLIFLVISKYIGKKYIIMFLLSVSMCCAVAIPNIPSEYVYIPASVVVALLSTAFFAHIGLVVKIFPTTVRATSLSMTMLIGRIGVLIANFSVANLMYSYCEYLFYSLAVTSACVVVMVACLVTEPIKEKQDVIRENVALEFGSS